MHDTQRLKYGLKFVFILNNTCIKPFSFHFHFLNTHGNLTLHTFNYLQVIYHLFMLHAVMMTQTVCHQINT